MKHPWRILLLMSVLLPSVSTAGIHALPRSAPAQAAVAFVTPNVSAPEADVILTGYDFSPDSVYDVHAVSGSDDILIGAANSDTVGRIQQVVSLPALSPSVYAVQFYVLPDFTLVATTTLTILPPPTLALNPTNGSPGTSVTVTVNGLTPGSLRLDYAGAPIVGPVIVTGSAYTGVFTVPSDRPAMLGETAAITATNFVGTRVAGRAYASFQTELPPPPPPYAFDNVVIASPAPQGGSPFTVTGQINPPPVGPLTQFKLKALWKTAAGKFFPIKTQSTILQANGNFQLIGVIPSLYNGDAQGASSGEQIKLTLSGPNNVVQVGALFGMPITAPPSVRIRVVNQQGQPIVGAWVSTTGLGTTLGVDDDPGSASASASASQFQAMQPNQFFTFFDPFTPPGQNPFACPPTGAYGPTDNNGYFFPDSNLDALVGDMGKKIPVGDGIHFFQLPTTGTLNINVNAWWQGYGTTIGTQPQLYTRLIEYRKSTNRFHDPATGAIINVNPITVTLPALPPNAEVKVPIVYSIEGAVPTGSVLKQGYSVPSYGTFVSLADLAGDPAIGYSYLSPLRASFKHDATQFGSLGDVHFYLDGVDKGTFQSAADSQCTGASNFSFSLNNAHLVTAGAHTAKIVAQAAGGSVSEREFVLKFVKSPDWFHDASFKNRQASWWSGAGVTLRGEQLPAGSPGSSSALGANVPKIGQLDNAAGANSQVIQTLKASGDSSTWNYGAVSSQALNTTAPNQPTNQSAAGNNPLTFGGGPLTIINTGWMPLFRDHWGIWPVASATVGADMAFKATLVYNGTITLKPAASTLFVKPSATVNVDAWFDLSAIFGLVSASAHALPSITVDMPVKFVNGVKNDSDICFRYRLDIKWKAKVGKCPLCDKDSGTKNIFNDYTPKSALCAPNVQRTRPLAITAPPSEADPALAADGFGHTLALWSDDANNLQYKTFNGATWSATQLLLGDGANRGPKVAYFAPNQAVAVWTHNALTALQAQTADITDTVKAQHVMYAVWNGMAWSSPQNLTLPTTGEGSVALASCPSATSGCPSGGAATAVWVRDAAGQLEQRQFRLYAAVYQNGAWSVAQAIDAVSTATDSEPGVVYDNGAPLVVWVRDADREVSTIGDRRLAYRRLDGASPIVAPGDLPSGIAEPSAAIDALGNLKIAFTRGEDADAFTGNQRTLHTALRTCSPGCAWSVQKLQDSHGRALRAERPLLVIDANGNGIVTFRGLGFGPLPNNTYQAFPEDALGMVTLTGEAAQVIVDFASTVHSPAYLSNDGAVNWHPAAVFDPALNQIHTIIVKGAAPVVPLAIKVQHSTAVPLRASTIYAPTDEPALQFGSATFQPDFVAAEMKTSSPYPQPGDMITATIQVRNDGLSGSRGMLAVVATWDGEPGVGVQADLVQMPVPNPGESTEVSFTPTPPANLDVPHILYITVNPAQAISEQSAANNRISAAIGGLSAPSDVVAMTQPGKPLVFLQWTPLSDPRVAGYRVERTDTDGNVEAIGSTLTAGFADITAQFNRTYTYAVFGYTADGVDSAPSDGITVTIDPFRVYLPVIFK